MTGEGRFAGTLTGRYASSNGKECKNHVDFDCFEYQELTE